MVFGYGALALSDPTETEILPADTIMSSLVTVGTTALLLWALRDVSPEREEVSTAQQKPLVPAGSTA